MTLKAKIGVHTLGNKETRLANTLRIYVPYEVRSAANLEAGDTFEYAVVNNKVKLRYCPMGDLVLTNGYFISIRASAFVPPLRLKNTEHVEAIVKDGWLAFQVPKSFELLPKGFQLLEDVDDE